MKSSVLIRSSLFLAAQIKDVVATGIEVAVVNGGGNINVIGSNKVDRATATVGMLQL